MQRLFQKLIRLYPQEYRDEFGEEMLGVLSDLTANRSEQSSASSALHIGAETAALLSGGVRERLAKWTNPTKYLSFRAYRPFPPNQSGNLSDISMLQRRRYNALRLMERAIAHHDFPGARFYSDQERKTRDLIERREGRAD